MDNAPLDAGIRVDVVHALMLDVLLPRIIEASVEHGVVTLTGTAERQYQRKEAEFVAGTVAGVTGVENNVHIVPPTPEERQHPIRTDIHDRFTFPF